MTTNRRKTRLRPRVLALFVLLGAATIWGGLLTVQSVAAGSFLQHAALGATMKGGFHGGTPFADLTEAEIDARVARIVKHVAIEIDATDAQSAKIAELVAALVKEMRPMHAQMKASRDEVHALLTADQIDRAALETIRAARIAEIDQMSQRALTAAADVAEVLTPEQRRVLDQRMRELRSMFRRHRH